MLTPAEYHQWLLNSIEGLTEWSKPSAGLPDGGIDVVEVEEEWPGPELSVFEDAADIVREAGEIALRLGLPDLYTATRVPSPMIAIPAAKEVLGRCLAVCNEMLKDAAWVAAATTRVEAKPDNGVDEQPGLSMTCQRAYAQFLMVEEQVGRVTDREAYDWFRREECSDLPPYETWARYVRKARKYYNTQKNSPRAGRTGRSIVSIHDIADSRNR